VYFLPHNSLSYKEVKYCKLFDSFKGYLKGKSYIMIGVSSCIVKEACRYDGNHNEEERAVRLMEYGAILKLCPEVLGGLATPRPPAEIRYVDGVKRVFSREGNEVTQAFEEGARKTLKLCQDNRIHHVVLKDRSPSCGKSNVYDGTFSGTLIEGNGITVDLLEQHGINVYKSSNAPYEKLMVYDYLETQGIKYKVYQHEPVFTVEEAKKIEVTIEGEHCKNLFLRDHKKKNFYLVVLPQWQEVHLKEIAESIGANKLSFSSPEQLYEHLGVKPGSVGAFALLYDKKKIVQLFVSKELNKDKDITFHPNENDETLGISYHDFIKYVDSLGYIMNEF